MTWDEKMQICCRKNQMKMPIFLLSVLITLTHVLLGSKRKVVVVKHQLYVEKWERICQFFIVFVIMYILNISCSSLAINVYQQKNLTFNTKQMYSFMFLWWTKFLFGICCRKCCNETLFLEIIENYSLWLFSRNCYE